MSMMLELGFPSLFIKLVMRCVETVSYSVLINGIHSKPFQAAKGLRQGDPLSPFPFCYVNGTPIKTKEKFAK